MIGPAARRTIDGLLAEVGVLRARVPPRCAGFHRDADGLEQELRRCVQRWWPPWVRDEELARFRELVAELRAAGPGFARLAGRLLALDERVRGLREHRPTPADPQVVSWIGRQCDGWSGLLARLGEAQRRAEVEAEEARLADLEAELRAAEEAVSILAELARAVAALPNQLAAAPLTAHLVGLREQVLARNATAAWLAEARRFLAPLAQLQRAAAAPASGDATTTLAPSDDLVALLTLLEAWSLATGLLASDVHDLRPRVLHGGGGGGDELTAEVTALLARLLDMARSGRDEARQQLDGQLADLRKACGLQPEVERIDHGLHELSRRAVDDPADHEEWDRTFQQLWGSFEGLANALDERIYDVFAARLAAAAAAIEDIVVAELPADLLDRRDRLDGERQRLAELRSWKDVLRSLRRADQLLEELRALAAEIDAERAAAVAAQQRRTALLDELRQLSPPTLRPRERLEVEQCLQRLESWDGAAFDLRRRRLSLEPIVEWGEGLRARLRQAEERAQALRSALQARLEELHRADYGLGCRELVDRVEALVHGVPASPRAWLEVEDQLAAADVLLERLDHHGRRLAARRFEESLTLLRRARQGRLDLKLRQEVTDLLAQLESAGGEELPPAPVRYRVAGLCRRVRLARREGAWR